MRDSRYYVPNKRISIDETSAWVINDPGPGLRRTNRSKMNFTVSRVANFYDQKKKEEKYSKAHVSLVDPREDYTSRTKIQINTTI